MSKDRPKNMAASVRARLTDLARKQGEDFQLVLTRYAIERLLYRLSQTGHAAEFVLKGAMLFRLWAGQPHRPTRDLDLLGRGDPSVERLAAVFRAVCGAVVVDDGLLFDPATVTAGKIKEDQEYEGVRVGCVARLGQARIDLQVDVGFGDAVTPGPVTVQYPGLLDLPAPELPADGGVGGRGTYGSPHAAPAGSGCERPSPGIGRCRNRGASSAPACRRGGT